MSNFENATVSCIAHWSFIPFLFRLKLTTSVKINKREKKKKKEKKKKDA